LRGGTGDVGALVILVLVVFWCGVIDVGIFAGFRGGGICLIDFWRPDAI